MWAWLGLAFICLPFAELYVLLKVGRSLGAGPTLGLVVLTGVAGAGLARMQGLRVLRRVQEAFAAGRLPAGELLDGVLVLIAALLLITPGFLTDAAGLLLLVPWTRQLARALAARCS